MRTSLLIPRKQSLPCATFSKPRATYESQTWTFRLTSASCEYGLSSEELRERKY